MAGLTSLATLCPSRLCHAGRCAPLSAWSWPSFIAPDANLPPTSPADPAIAPPKEAIGATNFIRAGIAIRLMNAISQPRNFLNHCSPIPVFRSVTIARTALGINSRDGGSPKRQASIHGKFHTRGSPPETSRAKSLRGRESRPGASATRTRPSRSTRSEEHTSELQSRGHLVCRLLLEKKKERGKRPE